MKVLLNPDSKNELISLYKRAIESAEEIYLATAFLTDWSFSIKPRKDCRKFVALVGTNFGLTRKAACLSLLDWLPQRLRGNVFAFPSNMNTFHPKVLVWKKRDEYFALIGSSNMTSAAMSDNYEVNAFNNIGRDEYEKIVQWFNECIKYSDPLSKSWLEKYIESKIGSTKGKKSKKKNDNDSQVQLDLDLPKVKGYRSLLNERRKKQKIFLAKKDQILQLLKSNANGSMSNDVFWEKFTQLWHRRWDAEDCFRFQGSGVERTCTRKNNWKEATSALIEIIDNEQKLNQLDLDELVANKIDSLAYNNEKNPARSAWLSEILCQFFPEKYPVLNDPVRTWIRKKKKWTLDRGGTEGQKYIDLSRRLRSVLRQNRGYVNNLAEIDTLLWKICPPQKKRT